MNLTLPLLSLIASMPSRLGLATMIILTSLSLIPKDSSSWDIYPFVNYDSDNLFVGDFALLAVGDTFRFANPTAARDNLLSRNANSGISRTDQALVMLRSSIYEPSAVSSDPNSQLSRADTVIYSSTSPESALYIAPMDSVYQEGSVLKSYRTNNLVHISSRLITLMTQVA